MQVIQFLVLVCLQFLGVRTGLYPSDTCLPIQNSQQRRPWLSLSTHVLKKSLSPAKVCRSPTYASLLYGETQTSQLCFCWRNIAIASFYAFIFDLNTDFVSRIEPPRVIWSRKLRYPQNYIKCDKARLYTFLCILPQNGF